MEENGISVEKLKTDKIFIALSENYIIGKSVLSWAFNHFRQNETTIVIVHVCTPHVKVPPPMIKEVHPLKLEKEKQDEIESVITAYLSDCEEHKFNAEKLVRVADITEQGLVDIIHQYGVNKLIIGTGRPSETGAQMSNIANMVMNKADPSCNIWFTRNGELLFARGSCGLTQQEKESCGLTQQEKEKNRRSYTDIYNLIQKDSSEALNSNNDSELPNETTGTNDKTLLLMYEWEHSSHLKEMRRRKELEENLAKEKRENYVLAKEKLALEERIADFDRSSKDGNLKQNLKVEEQNQLRVQQDKAVMEARKLRNETKILKLMLCFMLFCWMIFWINF